jgi:hypothetical protein
MTTPEIRALARRLASLEASTHSRGEQLAYSSLEDGALREFSLEGEQVAQYGKQFDGTSAAATLVSPAPPAPSRPGVLGVAGGLVLTWDGTFEGDITVVAPMDWRQVDVVVGPVGMDPIATPPSVSITSPRGGEVFVPLEPGEYAVALVSRTLAGRPSEPSPVATGTALALVDQQQFADALTDLAAAQARLDAAEGALDANDTELAAAKARLDSAEAGVAQALADAVVAAQAAQAAQDDADAASALATAAQGAAGAAQDDANAANSLASIAKGAADAAATAAGEAQADADAANSLATLAKSTADSKITAYRQASAPTTTGRVAGDLWVDSDDGLLYVWTGSWTVSPDQRVATVIASNATKTTVFAQTSSPSTSGRTVGDLWIDTDDGNKIYDWPSTGGWTARLIGAPAISATARQLGSVNVYRQSAAPATGMVANDLWVDSDDGLLYIYASGWQLSADQRVATLVTSNATKITAFAQTSAPPTTGRTNGDLWLDTDDGNRPYVWDGAWTDRRDATIAAASLLASQAKSSADAAPGLIATAKQQAIDAAALTAQAKADTAKAEALTAAATTAQQKADAAAATAQAAAITAAAADATTKANNAQAAAIAVANTKIAVYRQSAAPTGGTYKVNGDLWLDSDDGLVYVATTTSGGWTLHSDQRIGLVVTSNATKTTVFAQTSQPPTTGRTIGDIWLDTDDGNKIYDWSGSWTARLIGAPAVGFQASEIGGVPSILPAANGANAKTFTNPLVWGQEGQAMPGLVVIDTPITFSNKMFTVRLKGYNYLTGNSDIDITLGGYAYGTTTVLNHGFNNAGSMPLTARLGRKIGSNTLSIILKSELAGGLWYYPKISVTEAVIGYTMPPDSWLQGWSAALLADEAAVASAYDGVIAAAAYDAGAAAAAANALATLAKSTADGKITVLRQASAPATTGRTIGDLWLDSDDGLIYSWTGAWTLNNDPRIAQALADAATAQSTAEAMDAMNVNPSFTDWPAGQTAPTGWVSYPGATSLPIRETALARTKPNAVRFNVTTTAGQFPGLQATGIPLPLNVEYVTMALDVYLVSGTLSGAGVLLDWVGMTGTNRAAVLLKDELPTLQAGRWYRLTKVIRRPASAAGTHTSWTTFLFADYAALGAMASKNIIFNRYALRPSSSEEIAAYLAAPASTVSDLTTVVNTKTTVFAQTSQPPTTGRTIGDIWLDTDDGNKIYDWSGSWTARLIGAPAISATARQLGSIAIYRQSAAPVGTFVVGDLWFDLDDGLVYVATTTAGGWTLHSDQRIASTLSTVTGLSGTVATKTTLFAQTSAPSTTGRTTGDMWVDTDDGNKIYTWTGAWTVRQLGDSALASLDLNKLVVVGTANLNVAVANEIAAKTAAFQKVDIGNLFVSGDTVMEDVVANQLAAEVGEFLTVRANNLEATMALVSQLTSGGTGRRWEADADGIRLFDADGTLIVGLPTDPNTPASVAGDFTATSLTVSDQLAIRGLVNEISKGAQVVIAGGTTAPSSPPSVIIDWDTYIATVYTQNTASAFDPVRTGWQRYSDHYYYAQVLYGSGVSIGRAQALSAYGIGQRDQFYGTGYDNDIWVNPSLTVIGNIAYVLGLNKAGNGYYVAGYNLDTKAQVSKWQYPHVFGTSGSAHRKPVIGVNGSNVSIAFTNYSSSVVQWRTYNPTTGAQVGGTGVTNFTTTLELTSFGFTNADFGSSRMFLTVDGSANVFILSSAGVSQPDEHFPTASTHIRGCGWDNVIGRFVTFDAPGSRMYIHSATTWTSQSSLWWISNTWFDSNATGGTHETAQSPLKSFLMKKRARLLVTTGILPVRPIPNTTDDATAARIYIGRGSGSPARTYMERIATLADGVRTLLIDNLTLPPAAAVSPPPAASDFPASAPGRIISADGSKIVLNGDGTWTLGPLSADVNGKVTATAPIAGPVDDWNIVTAASSPWVATLQWRYTHDNQVIIKVNGSSNGSTTAANPFIFPAGSLPAPSTYCYVAGRTAIGTANGLDLFAIQPDGAIRMNRPSGANFVNMGINFTYPLD